MSGLNHAVKFNAGKATGYTADPEDLKLVTDPKHYLYQERVKLPVDPFLCRIPGNPEKEIPRYLAILDCAPCIREAIESGEVHMGDAPKLAKMSTDAQAEWLAARRAGGVAPGKREKAARSGPAPIRGKHRARALDALGKFSALHGAVQLVRYLDTGDRDYLDGINPEMVRALDAALALRKPGRKAAA